MGSREGLNLTTPTPCGGLGRRDPELCAQQDSYRVYRLSTTSPSDVHELILANLNDLYVVCLETSIPQTLSS